MSTLNSLDGELANWRTDNRIFRRFDSLYFITRCAARHTGGCPDEQSVPVRRVQTTIQNAAGKCQKTKANPTFPRLSCPHLLSGAPESTVGRPMA
eukprot:7824095-Pyramimonas_sp.AAC.1